MRPPGARSHPPAASRECGVLVWLLRLAMATRYMARQPYRPVHATLAERFGLMTPPNVLLEDHFRRAVSVGW